MHTDAIDGIDRHLSTRARERTDDDTHSTSVCDTHRSIMAPMTQTTFSVPVDRYAR